MVGSAKAQETREARTARLAQEKQNAVAAQATKIAGYFVKLAVARDESEQSLMLASITRELSLTQSKAHREALMHRVAFTLAWWTAKGSGTPMPLGPRS